MIELSNVIVFFINAKIKQILVSRKKNFKKIID